MRTLKVISKCATRPADILSYPIFHSPFKLTLFTPRIFVGVGGDHVITNYTTTSAQITHEHFDKILLSYV